MGSNGKLVAALAATFLAGVTAGILVAPTTSSRDTVSPSGDALRPPASDTTGEAPPPGQASTKQGGQPVRAALEVGSARTPGTLPPPSDDSPGIRGVVFGVSDSTLENVVVQLLRFRGDEPPTPMELRVRGVKRPLRMKSGNRFAFQGLRPGRYCLAAGLGDLAINPVVVDVDRAVVERNLVLPEPERRQFLVVHVHDPAGEPVADARFLVGAMLVGAGDRRSMSTNKGIVLGRDRGTYRVQHNPKLLRAKPTDGWQPFVEVQSDSWGNRRVSYAMQPAPEVTVRFARPARGRVHITNFDPSRIDGTLRVRLVSTSGRAPELPDWFFARGGTEPDAKGRTPFGPLAPGEYEAVLLYESAHRPGTPEVLTKRLVRLNGGDNTVRIAIPPLHEILVHVPGADPGQIVSLESTQESARRRRHAYLRADRRARFPGLPAGDYRVSCRGASNREQEVTLPGVAEVTLRSAGVNALLVRITDPKGAMARAGLRNGDLILRAGPWELTDRSQIRTALALEAHRKTAVLLVSRSGEQVELTVPGSILKGGPDAGGSVTPSRR